MVAGALFASPSINASGIVNNSGSTSEDSVTVAVLSLDSLGNPALSDSFFVAVFSGGKTNASVFIDSGTISTLVGLDSIRLFGGTLYYYSRAVADIDGNGAAGEYSGVVIAKKNSPVLRTTTRFSFQIVGNNFSSGYLASLDAAITSRMATYTQPTGFLAATFPSGTLANTTNITAGTMTTTTNLTTNNDKTNYTLSTAGIDALLETDTVTIATATSVGRTLQRAYTESLKPTVAGRTLDVATTGEAGVDFSNTTGGLGAAEFDNDAFTAAKFAADVGLEFADAIWDEDVGTHSILGSFGNRFKALSLVDAEAAAGTLSSDSFTTTLVNAVNAHYVGATLVFTSGSNSHQSRLIIAYTGATKSVKVDPAFEVTPSIGDDFSIVFNPFSAPLFQEYVTKGAWLIDSGITVDGQRYADTPRVIGYVHAPENMPSLGEAGDSTMKHIMAADTATHNDAANSYGKIWADPGYMGSNAAAIWSHATRTLTAFDPALLPDSSLGVRLFPYATMTKFSQNWADLDTAGFTKPGKMGESQNLAEFSDTSQASLAVWNKNLSGASLVAGSAGRLVRGLAPIDGAAITGTLSTTQFTSNFTNANTDFYKGQAVTFISGSNAGQTRLVTAYNGATKMFTVTPALSAAPANNDQVVVASVSNIESVTGSVGSVTGNVGGNVAGSVASVTGSVGSVTGNVGGNVVGSVASVTGAVGSVTGAVGSVTGSVTVGTNNDKTGYALSSGDKNTLTDLIWDEAQSGHGTVGTFGYNVDARISTVGTGGFSTTERDSVLKALHDAAIHTKSWGSSSVRGLTAGTILASTFGLGAIDGNAIGPNAFGASEADASLIDEFWDEAQSGHSTAGTFGLYLDSRVSLVSGGGGGGSCGTGAYTVSWRLLDTSQIPDLSVSGVNMYVNNLAQNGTIYQDEIDPATGLAQFNLNAGTWVIFHTDARYKTKLDTFTVAGALIDTQMTYLDKGSRTVVYGTLQGAANNIAYAQARVQLLPIVAGEELRINDTLYGQTLSYDTTDALGQFSIALYRNDQTTTPSAATDSSFYRWSFYDRANRPIRVGGQGYIDTYLRAADQGGDGRVKFNSMPRLSRP